MRGNLSNDIVSIKIEEGSKRPIALHEKSLFGKIESDSLNLSLIEACYLLEKGRLDIYEDDVECSVGYIIDLLKDNGKNAYDIVKAYKPVFTKEQYVKRLDDLNKTTKYEYMKGL